MMSSGHHNKIRGESKSGEMYAAVPCHRPFYKRSMSTWCHCIRLSRTGGGVVAVLGSNQVHIKFCNRKELGVQHVSILNDWDLAMLRCSAPRLLRPPLVCS